MKKTIVITNDDGVYGPGLEPLVKELKKLADVLVIVPDHDRSAVSHSITLNRPLHIREMAKNLYTIHGTPADCVRLGVIHMMNRKVDLVVSGINTGPNLGQDVIYSGTVAGAREGALLGIPSIAVSVADADKADYNFSAKVTAKLAKKALKTGMQKQVFLNVNIPAGAKQMKIVSLGERIYDDDIECRLDPRGRKYYWLAGKSVSGILQEGMDISAARNGHISITPIEVTPKTKHLFTQFKKWITRLS